MRRAIQRCSTPLLRTLTPRFSGSVSHRLDGQLWAGIYSPARQPGAAGLHQTSRTRQGEAVAAQPQTSEDAASNLITRFDELESRRIVHPNVVRAITRDMRLETMTDVQTKTINEALHGDDIIAQAKTGTGKTLAFLLPILQNIISIDPQLAEPSGRGRRNRTTADDIRALIISPTRELAEQIAEEAKKLVKHTGLIVQTAVGGTQKRQGLAAIQHQGCHILVGTPGRLKDILSDPYTRVQAPDLSALVFDEADRLLDQGFWPEIQEIMRLLPTTAEHDRQTMMFSATVPKTVVDLVRSTLKPGFQFVKCVRDDEEPTHERVPQHLVQCVGLENGLPVVTELCSNAIVKSKESGGNPFKAIVYFNSTAEVSLAAEVLRKLRAPNEQVKRDAFGDTKPSHPWAPTKIFDIHAKLTQSQRTFAADAFRNARSAILLSSDVTARGMDFPNVTHVIQIGLPSSTEQYIHRIGRTGRAGKGGEGWLILNQIESSEGHRRLRSLPLRRDESLVTAKLDLKEAAQVPAGAGMVLRMYQEAMRPVSYETKAKVYKAMLGVFQWVSNKRTVVEAMNNLSKFGWGMSTPPSIAPGLAARLGISRLPGINLGHDEVSSDYSGMRGGPRSGGSGGMFGRNDRQGGYGQDSGHGASRGGGRYGGFRNDGYGPSRGGDRHGGGRRDGGFGRRDSPFGQDFQPRQRRVEVDPFAM